MKTKMHELSQNACKARREFSLSLSEGSNDNFEKTGIIKGAIRDIFAGLLSEADLEAHLEREMAKLSYLNDKQRSIHVKDAFNQIVRFTGSVRDLGRSPMRLFADDVVIGKDFEVRVLPDYAFLNEKGVVEVVRIKTSKPTMTQKAARDSLELYALLCYARRLVHNLQKRGLKIRGAQAAIYFLRKASDSNRRAEVVFTKDFFDGSAGAKNIVRLLDEGRDTDLRFLPIKQQFMDGVEQESCRKEDCEKCQIFDVCKYTKAPIAINLPVVKKSLSDLSLTPSQAEAIEVEEGTVRINAGAGAGKTMTIVLRAATLISKGVKPEEILLITFTAAAAEEIRSRIELCLEDFGLDVDVSKMNICTFNAFGYEIIKKEWKRLDGFTDVPKVIDEVERNHIISDLLKENEIADLDYRNMTLNMPNAIGAIPMAARIFDVIKKNSYGYGDEQQVAEELDMARRFCSLTSIKQLIGLYDRYDDHLRAENLIEFSDQEVLLFEILRKDPYYLEGLGFKHVIIDEFQDSSKNQIDLMKAIVKAPDFKSMMVVGDDSQSIYGFRDTSPEYMINFEKYIGTKVTDINLLENHRSTPEIIDFANKLNAKNRHRVIKDLVATRPSGSAVQVHGFFKSADEQDFVVGKIKEKLDAGRRPEDIAVICATKSELLKMADALSEAKIPSVLMNPENLSENSRVRAAIAMMEAMRDENAERDLLTYANAAAGGDLFNAPETLIRAEMAKARVDLDKIRTLPEEAKKEAIMERLKALDHDNDEVYESFMDTLSYKRCEKIEEYCRDFYAFGAKSAFRRTRNYPGVVLTTAHSSKGLEWPVVFNMISKYHTGEMKLRVEEEKRRLLFVSATRARDELYITAQYTAYGRKGDYTYNRFLIDCFDCLDMEFAPSTIEAERTLRPTA